MRKIILQFFLVSFLFVVVKSAVAESYERTWALYSQGFYEEAYKEIERSTGPLSQSYLWLLGEMHFLGHGTQEDLSLGRKFIQQASSKSLPFKNTNLPSALKPICFYNNTFCSDTLKSKAFVAPFAQSLGKQRENFGTDGCERSSLFPLALFYYKYDSLSSLYPLNFLSEVGR